jgi:CheY-like chemotaxis protein
MTSTEPVILYVEDDPQSRKLMSMLLKGRMKLPNVTILEDSENIVANVEALNPKPDVILLDIHMKPYFPAKNFMIKMDGQKGDDGNEWDTSYDQQ